MRGQRVHNDLGLWNDPVARLRLRRAERRRLTRHGGQLAVDGHRALKEPHPVDGQPEALALAHTCTGREGDQRA